MVIFIVDQEDGSMKNADDGEAKTSLKPCCGSNYQNLFEFDCCMGQLFFMYNIYFFGSFKKMWIYQNKVKIEKLTKIGFCSVSEGFFQRYSLIH